MVEYQDTINQQVELLVQAAELVTQTQVPAETRPLLVDCYRKALEMTHAHGYQLGQMNAEAIQVLGNLELMLADLKR